jgi:hypothetical protein
MPQVPPSGPTYPDPVSYPGAPGPYIAQPPPRSSLWMWIVGALGLMIFMPCVCCGLPLAYSFTVKDLTLSNGEHLGGSPMHIKFDYAFRTDGRGEQPKAFYIVVQAANGTKRESSIGGFGFGVPMRGTWRFGNAVDLGPENNKKYVQVWIEGEQNGNRSTASNTLTIYPKS